jgi:hypothetical protein
MKFVCLLPVRDEADIIAQCLDHLLHWADEVHVFDTGSTDDTWEIVQGRAATEKRVHLMRKEPVYFSETRLRSWMFHQARRGMRAGDWFLRVDADEFHHVSPPQFVRERLHPRETVVYHQYYDFRLTESEVRNWEEGRETPADRARPIEDRRRWYTAARHSEPRLCRYRETMQWPPTVGFPFNAGFVARARLPIRHYPHRDPAQLEKRCRLRAALMAEPENEIDWTSPDMHWTEAAWRKFVTPDDLPDLKYWQPGRDLPEVHQSNHLRPAPVRALQWLIHTFCLPLLDRRRAAYPEGAAPQPISPAVQMRLSRAAEAQQGASS